MNIPQFDEATHSYQIDGKPAPGVTSIIRSCLPGCAFWTDQARDFGTAMHKAIQYHAEGDLDYDSLDETLKPRLDAYLEFCASTGFKPDIMEQPLYHPTLKYCGTLDQCQTGRVIVDFKSGAKLPEVALQLAAYANLLPNPHLYERWCVQLLPTGEYKLESYRKQEITADFNVFLSMLNFYNWRGRNGYGN